jgi:3-oxoadipate enol-lactonase/4-carboxymuconolactone decarboxylase
VPKKYVQIDGVAIFVHHTGPTTLPERSPEVGERPILCLHAEGSSGGVFAGLFGELEADHGLVAFDQPGHGRSGELDSLADVGRMAALTAAFHAKLGLPPCIVLGHSMGAAVALELALHHPACVSALVLYSAGAPLPITDDALELARRVSEGKERRPFDPRLFSKQTSPDVMRATFMESMKTDPRATYGDLRASAAWNPGDALSGVDLPALVIRGEDDRAESAAPAASLADALPNASGVDVPEAGYWLAMEQPGAFAAEVRRFVGGLP